MTVGRDGTPVEVLDGTTRILRVRCMEGGWDIAGKRRYSCGGGEGESGKDSRCDVVGVLRG
jgi:hypothetical protein